MMPGKISRENKSRDQNILPMHQDFRGAGVSLVLTQEGPAVFCVAKKNKIAGGTPAPQNQLTVAH
jgi:hypothetical protein